MYVCVYVWKLHTIRKQHEDVLLAFSEYKNKQVLSAEHSAKMEIMEEDLHNARCV